MQTALCKGGSALCCALLPVQTSLSITAQAHKTVAVVPTLLQVFLVLAPIEGCSGAESGRGVGTHLQSLQAAAVCGQRPAQGVGGAAQAAGALIQQQMTKLAAHRRQGIRAQALGEWQRLGGLDAFAEALLLLGLPGLGAPKRMHVLPTCQTH